MQQRHPSLASCAFRVWLATGRWGLSGRQPSLGCVLAGGCVPLGEMLAVCEGSLQVMPCGVLGMCVPRRPPYTVMCGLVGAGMRHCKHRVPVVACMLCEAVSVCVGHAMWMPCMWDAWVLAGGWECVCRPAGDPHTPVMPWCARTIVHRGAS